MFRKDKKVLEHIFIDTIMQDRGNGEKEYELELSFTTSKGLRKSLEMSSEGKKNMLRLAKKAPFSNDEMAFVDVYLENYQNGNYGWMLINTDKSRYVPTEQYLKETFYYDEGYEQGGFNDFRVYDTNSNFVIYISEVTEHTKLIIAIFDPWGVVSKKDIAGILDYKVVLTRTDEKKNENTDNNIDEDKNKAKTKKHYETVDDDILYVGDDILDVDDDMP